MENSSQPPRQTKGAPPGLAPITLSLADAIAISGLSRSRIYLLLAAGKIRARKAGKATLIEATSLNDYLNALPAASFRAPKAPV